MSWTSCSPSRLCGSSSRGRRWTQQNYHHPQLPVSTEKDIMVDGMESHWLIKKSKDRFATSILLLPEVIQCSFGPISGPETWHERVQIICFFQDPQEGQCHPLLNHLPRKLSRMVGSSDGFLRRGHSSTFWKKLGTPLSNKDELTIAWAHSHDTSLVALTRQVCGSHA